MPNWCGNHLTISHKDIEKLKEFQSAYNSNRTCSHYLPVAKDTEAQLEAWGTKWDFGRDGGPEAVIKGNSIYVSFSTAWSPPLGLYSHLAAKDYAIDATFCELGEGFVGYCCDGMYRFFDLDYAPDALREEWELYLTEEEA